MFLDVRLGCFIIRRLFQVDGNFLNSINWKGFETEVTFTTASVHEFSFARIILLVHT